LLAATSVAAGQTGIKEKKPVFGGACRLCPWGAMAELMKAATKPHGYDVQICYNCNPADALRIVSEARMPPPYKPDPAVPKILAPRNAPGLGAIDFGAVAIQFLRNAYRGTGIYAKEKPKANLRLFANVQDPSYVLVAAKAETGITDLSQRWQKRWPFRGIERPIPTVVRTGTAIYGRADMPDDFAYIVAKAMDEQQQLLQWSRLNFSCNVHTVWNGFEVPLHPGAARYYKEKGYTK
jgi:hypothetical protein